MARSALAALAVVLAGVSTSLPAFADAVPGPPEDCPPGSYGETSHSGQWCQPSTCKTDDECKSLDNHWARKKSGPHVCRSQALCVLRTKVRPGGRSGFRNPGAMIDREVAQSDCNKGCSGGATCERVKRCVVTNVPATPEEPPSDGKDASVVSIPTASPDAAPIDVKVVDAPPSSSGTPSAPPPTGARGCGCNMAREDATLGFFGAGVLALVTLFRRKRPR